MAEALILPLLLALVALGVWGWRRWRDRGQPAEFADTQGLDRGVAEPPPASTNGLGGTGPRRP